LRSDNLDTGPDLWYTGVAGGTTRQARGGPRMVQEKPEIECTVEECHAGDCYLPGCACACHGEDTLAGPALPA